MNLPEHRETILSFLTPHFEDIRSAFETEWRGEESASLQKWLDLEKSVEESIMNRLGNAHQTNPIQNIIIHYGYPRLDVNVSKQLHHLLKSPFSVHPQTGKISVPIDGERFKDFDPFSVPSIQDLRNELQQNKQEKGNHSLVACQLTL